MASFKVCTRTQINCRPTTAADNDSCFEKKCSDALGLEYCSLA